VAQARESRRQDGCGVGRNASEPPTPHRVDPHENDPRGRGLGGRSIRGVRPRRTTATGPSCRPGPTGSWAVPSTAAARWWDWASRPASTPPWRRW